MNGPYDIYTDAGQDDPTCPVCGSGDVDWVDCPQCAGEGGFDDEELMDEDPLWYGPGDYEECDFCGGEGGWWQCFNAHNHPKESKGAVQP